MSEYIGEILYIKPNYIVSVPEFDIGRNYSSIGRVKNNENLKNNKHGSILSEKAQKRIKNAVNWLLASAKEKTVKNKSTGKTHNFKVNFITLTIPDTSIEVTERLFKSKLLHPFLMYCKKYYNLHNYIWKIEFHENGRLHAHLTTDCYIDKFDIRRAWNKILKSNGLLEDYHNKFSSMSLNDYLALNKNVDTRLTENKIKSFNYGTKTNWYNPNSTDIHSVWKVKNLGAYLAKYMSKNDQATQPIIGRIWGCNYELSDKNKCVLGINRDECADVLRTLNDSRIEKKEIKYFDIIKQKWYTTAVLYFLKPENWKEIIRGRVKEVYDRHRFNIRNHVLQI